MDVNIKNISAMTDTVMYNTSWSAVSSASLSEFDGASEGGEGGRSIQGLLNVLYKYVVPILYALITCTGLLGNALVIGVIVSRHRMRTVTNLLLASLAASDFSFVLVCPPFTAYVYAYEMEWHFGIVACKLMHYLLSVTVYVTIYTLVLVCAVRYMMIVRNASTKWVRTHRNAIFASVAIWIIASVVNIPVLYAYNPIPSSSDPSTYSCLHSDVETARRFYLSFFTFAYVLPLSLIGILSLCMAAYIRRHEARLLSNNRKSRMRKSQAIRLIVAVVGVFAAFWLPINIICLVFYFGPDMESTIFSPVFQTSIVICQVLAYSNSCINPLVYNFASRDFRESFREVLPCCCKGTGEASSRANGRSGAPSGGRSGGGGGAGRGKYSSAINPATGLTDAAATARAPFASAAGIPLRVVNEVKDKLMVKAKGSGEHNAFLSTSPDGDLHRFSDDGEGIYSDYVPNTDI
jgi:allatostatin receptor